MANRMLSLVYAGWVAYLDRQKYTREVLGSATRRIVHRLAFLVLDAWAELVGQKRRCRAIAARITGNHELGLLANGLAQWQRRAAAAYEHELKLRRALGMIRNRWFHAWRGALDEAKGGARAQGEALLPALARP